MHTQFLTFIKAKYPLQGKEAVNTASNKCPQYICEWIQDACEVLSTTEGVKRFGKGSSRTKKLVDSSGTKDRAATYSHALKMRAAISFWFAYICPRQCGHGEWLQVVESGNWQGNPSLSTTVSRYMRALNKMKVSSLVPIKVFYNK